MSLPNDRLPFAGSRAKSWEIRDCLKWMARVAKLFWRSKPSPCSCVKHARCGVSEQSFRKDSPESFCGALKGILAVLAADPSPPARAGPQRRLIWVFLDRAAAAVSSGHPAFQHSDLSITQLAIPPLPNLSDGSPNLQISVFLTPRNTTAGGVSKPCLFALCSCGSVRYAEASEAQGDPPCLASIRPNSAACLPA